VADSVESALYLAAREPVPEALDWIESEVADLIGRQQPDGFLENWYGEGNFNRTLLLYALYKSQGCRPEQWFPGLELGAVPDGDGVRLSLRRRAKIQFDFARHRRVMGFDKDYVRLNEFPEWFTVEENHLYRLRPSEGKARILLGSELIAGVVLEPGDWRVEPLGAPPYNEKWGQTHLFRDGGVYPR